MTERSDREWENLFISAAQRSRLTNKVPAHTHHHPGPGKNAHREAECRAAVSNRFGFKWRCLTAGGVHVGEIRVRTFAFVLSPKRDREGRKANIQEVRSMPLKWPPFEAGVCHAYRGKSIVEVQMANKSMAQRHRMTNCTAQNPRHWRLSSQHERRADFAAVIAFIAAGIPAYTETCRTISTSSSRHTPVLSAARI